jgi:hypothetical protein
MDGIDFEHGSLQSAWAGNKRAMILPGNASCQWHGNLFSRYFKCLTGCLAVAGKPTVRTCGRTVVGQADDYREQDQYDGLIYMLFRRANIRRHIYYFFLTNYFKKQ